MQLPGGNIPNIPTPQSANLGRYQAMARFARSAGNLLLQGIEIARLAGEAEYRRRRERTKSRYRKFVEQQIHNNNQPDTWLPKYNAFMFGDNENQGELAQNKEALRNPFARRAYEDWSTEFAENERQKIAESSIKATRKIAFNTDKQAFEEAVWNRDFNEAMEITEDAYSNNLITDDIYHQWMVEAERGKYKNEIFAQAVRIMRGGSRYDPETGEIYEGTSDQGLVGRDAAMAFFEKEFPRAYRNVSPRFNQIEDQREKLAEGQQQLENQTRQAAVARSQAIDALIEEVSEVAEEGADSPVLAGLKQTLQGMPASEVEQYLKNPNGPLRDLTRQRREALAESIAANSGKVEQLRAQWQQAGSQRSQLTEQQQKLLENTERIELITPRERDELRNRFVALLQRTKKDADKQVEQQVAAAEQMLMQEIGQYGTEYAYARLRSGEEFKWLRETPHPKAAQARETWFWRLYRENKQKDGDDVDNTDELDDIVVQTVTSFARRPDVSTEEMGQILSNLIAPVHEGKPKRGFDNVEQLEEYLGSTDELTKDQIVALSQTYALSPTDWNRLKGMVEEEVPDSALQAAKNYIKQAYDNNEIVNRYRHIEEEKGRAATLLKMNNDIEELIKEQREAGVEMTFEKATQIAENLVSREAQVTAEQIIEDANRETEQRGESSKFLFWNRVQGNVYERTTGEAFMEELQRGHWIGAADRVQKQYDALGHQVATDILEIAPTPREFEETFGVSWDTFKESVSRSYPGRSPSYGLPALNIARLRYDGGPVVFYLGNGRYATEAYLNIPRGNFLQKDIHMRVLLRSRPGQQINSQWFDPNDWELAHMPELPERDMNNLGINIQKRAESWMRLWDLNSARPDWQTENE
jgi:hypothetical protein